MKIVAAIIPGLVIGNTIFLKTQNLEAASTNASSPHLLNLLC